MIDVNVIDILIYLAGAVTGIVAGLGYIRYKAKKQMEGMMEDLSGAFEDED